MARDDWYRNVDWNSEIEAAFFAKLKRARQKSQYLRVQACTLSERHPRVALRLLEQYFSMGDLFDAAQAHVDQATAYMFLGQVPDALAAYEAALNVEARFPNVKTQAYLDFPFVVATRNIMKLYERALDLLDQGRERLTFPMDHFRWHASRALILNAVGVAEEARAHARFAMSAALQDHSGFRYHAGLGLVGDSYSLIQKRMADIAA